MTDTKNTVSDERLGYEAFKRWWKLSPHREQAVLNKARRIALAAWLAAWEDSALRASIPGGVGVTETAEPVAYLSRCESGVYKGEFEAEAVNPNRPPFNKSWSDWFPVYAAPSNPAVSGVCAWPDCTCATHCDSRKIPTLKEAYANVVRAVQAFDDAANVEETNWTGWGEQIVPPEATMRRVKAEQAHRAIRDADPRMYTTLSVKPQSGSDKP